MKSNRIFKIVATHMMTALIVAGSTYLPTYYKKFQLKSRSKEGRVLLNAVNTAIKATKAERGSYPKNLEESGFNPIGELHYNISLTEHTLEPSVEDFLPQSYYPFVDGKKYQVVVIGKLGPNIYHICKVGSEAYQKCVWITVENDDEQEKN